MLVDSHCHLNMLQTTEENPDIAAFVNSAKQTGVLHLLCVGVNLTEAQEVIDIAEQFPSVSCSVGAHPTDAATEEINAEKLTELARHPKVVAIGETGLDYYRLEESDSASRSNQQNNFRMQIQIACELQKPLIIHTRAAVDDTIKIMQEEQASQPRGVMHCFTESWQMAKDALDLDFYISISGIVTFKKAEQVKEVATKVPLNRLLVETDSPYLAPVPFRGKQNQPAYVRYVAEHIAELRGISFEELAEQTTNNFFDLFKGAANV